MNQKKITAALCSFGMSGKVFHAPLLQHHFGFNLYGVFERSSNEAVKSYPLIKRVSALDALLADDAIELVIVNTPNASHYEYAKKALLAGKHVIVEKPFVPTVAQGMELEELAKSENKQIAVYHNRRFDSDFLAVKKVVQEKMIGEIVEAEFHFDRYKQDLSPKQHKETPGEATGIVYDLGSHLIDQALHLFGMPEAVFGDIVIMRSISKVDDYFEIILFYNSKRVRLKGSYLVKQPVPSFVLHGTHGSFLKERADVQEANLLAGLYTAQVNWGIEPETSKGLLNSNVSGKDEIKNIISPQGNYASFYDQVYIAISENKPVPVTAAEGINVIKIIEAAFLSSKEKRVVAL